MQSGNQLPRSLNHDNVVNRPRRTVASYDDYAEAERAVDYLSDHGFPVERVAIVGHGLRYVEQVQ